jgi:hypothetical protein
LGHLIKEQIQNITLRANHQQFAASEKVVVYKMLLEMVATNEGSIMHTLLELMAKRYIDLSPEDAEED